MKIATGQPEDHPTPLPLNPQPAPDPVSPQFPGADSPADAASQIGGVMPATAMFAEQAAAGTADCAAAMSSGMGADADRRGRYEASMAPLGASAGDALSLPEVISDHSKHTGSPGSPDSGPAG